MRVVPPQDMVAYLEHLGALEQHARAAAVVPVSPAPARPIPAPTSASRGNRRGSSTGSLFRRLKSVVADWTARVLRGWMLKMCALMLLILIVAPSPTAAQPWDYRELMLVSRAPTLITTRDPEEWLLVALIVGYGALGGLSLVLFMRSRIAGKARAVVTAVPGRVIRRLCRKRADSAEGLAESPGPASDEPPAYRSTRSDDDPSDPLVDCWLERLDATLRLKGAKTLPEQVWSTDFRSHRGNVRSRNEDFALGFRFHAHDVIVMADGCGGVPCGFQASRIAACAAAVLLVSRLPVNATNAAVCEDALREAFASASAKLADATHIYQSTPLGNQQALLQTTLLIAVASQACLTIGYIGDGGAVLIRPTDGTEESVLQPMKAVGGSPNILGAVLGPQMIGEPSINTIQRSHGDLLLMGTDGIWDYVAESFSKQFVREAVVRGGRIGEALESALGLLADHKDEQGYVCADNLTLAVVAPDRTVPRFGSRYWAASAVPPSPSADPAPVAATEEAISW